MSGYIPGQGAPSALALAKSELCEACHLLYQRGYVASNDGNLSLRLDDGRFLITPSGVSKGRITPEMLVVCDGEGRVLEGVRHPSSESPMHWAVYAARPDVGAVVHAHPAAATAFAACRRPLDVPYLTEVVSGLGPIPVAPYALPSTPEVPESILPFVADHNGVLLANHGALTWGTDLWSAFDRMEQLEHTAKIYLNIALLGDGVPLTQQQVEAIRGLSERYRTLAAPLKKEESHG